MTSQRQKILVTVAALAAGFFSVSSIFWMLYFMGAFYGDPAVRDNLPAHQPLIALPCFILASLFWVAVVQTFRAKKTALHVILLGFLLAGLFCWYDLTHERYQACFYKKDGNTYVYLTWWFAQNP